MVNIFSVLYIFVFHVSKFSFDKKKKNFLHRYPVARAITRKIIFHAGPTNSGKTYHALERYMSAKTGVYCGPLKMLATEVYNKSNANVSISAVLRKCFINNIQPNF